ncbi:GNAT family N-acetyltransferase [Paenibacillus riograndensis]|uniref:Acetyltransferase n=1 Tax=Paenibacillus riograndensis SBR5 TaxID=1073571 RepID=A0A0E4CX13_9BACL|nr:GNAT family protein [Paenibacillus riograndensis]CQR55876.1 acetyltransferase [Paenibacillus riograndensis SBR5]
MEKSSHVYMVTDRLVIRQFGLQDTESFYKYRANPAVAQFQSWENYTYEDAESFVSKQMDHTPGQPGTWFQFAIVSADSDQLIGDCALHTLLDEPRIVELGFTLAPDHQGNGYIHEALEAILNYIFRMLGKHKAIAFTDVRNEKSIRVLERLGMRREGHLLQNYMSKGKWVDEYQYAVLQSEWLSRHRTNKNLRNGLN